MSFCKQLTRQNPRVLLQSVILAGFFQEQGTFTHRKQKQNWKSYCHIGFVMGVFANGSKLWYVIIMELINASGRGHCLPVPIQKSLKILQLLTCKIQPINHLSPYSELCYDCKQSLWKSINQVLEMHQNSAVAASTSTIGSAGNWGCSH